MDLAMIGLGKMGGNMARRLIRGGHRVVAYDRDPRAVEALRTEGAIGVDSLEALSAALAAPRAAWIMVPAGAPTEETVSRLASLLEPGDTVIDGGNSHFEDSIRRGNALAARSLHFVDAGVSGGVWGLENGYSLMVGGEAGPVDRLGPIFAALAPTPTRGWARVGPLGAGHYAKMVHNGIEYGLMQAYAEGFEILRSSRYAFDLPLLCEVWGTGGVIRSWLLELAGRAFTADPGLEGIEGFVPDSGEGRWTLAEAVANDVPAPVLYAALMTRFRSRQNASFQSKVLAALRREFGGHAVREGPRG